MNAVELVLVDRNVMHKLHAELGSSGLAAVTSLFAEQTPPLLNQLRDAISRSDQAEVRHIAHTLKGSSSTLGAVRMAALCRELEERAGLEAPAAQEKERVETLERAFEATRARFPESPESES